MVYVFLLNFTFANSVFDFDAKVVNVYDGDTIWVEHENLDTKIRILGIDTPELDHGQKHKSWKMYRCGQQAKKFAERYLLNKKVLIYKDTLSKNKWKYHRLLRYVYVPVYINWKKKYLPYGFLAVYYGWAKVYKRENFQNKKIYYRLQSIAKKYKRWIWSDKCKKFKTKFYKKKRKQKNTMTKYDCGYTYHKTWCDIKWNINRKWVKIYHLPWWRYYNITKISPRKWERWFCTEKEAISCNWRASYAK